ncbi:MAG: hypothetical protein M1541_19980 [Acidobacteria bacterium]|nr:hypothetical protein [Acidobacteriota bacterium]
MLNHTMEFLRIADVQPSDEKVRKRRECASELLTQVASRDNRALLLAFLQGVIGGFEGAPFSQDAAAVALLIKSIKDRDATLPHDLTENAIELRAVAAITIGELLTNQPDGAPADEAVLAALALQSALSSRPAVSNKYSRSMLGALATASEKVLGAAARRRRHKANGALARLDKLKKPVEGNDVWEAILPVVTAAVREVSTQEAVDREELDTLWWMFGAYSEVEQKPLAELSPSAAAFCSGFELAQQALLPPVPTAVAMVKRAVELDRKPSALGALSLQEAIGDWSASMLTALAPLGSVSDGLLRAHPALLPLSYACLRLRECKEVANLGGDFVTLTGLPLTHAQTPAVWGAQVFREAILQRFAADEED